MTLKETLQSDLIAALKRHDTLVVSTLRAVIGAVQSAEKGGKKAVEFGDEEVLKTIRQQLKQRRDSAKIYLDAGETERQKLEEAEATVLAGYLPSELTDEELDYLIRSVIELIPAEETPNFGAVMKSVVALTAGRADGGRISAMVRTVLAG